MADQEELELTQVRLTLGFGIDADDIARNVTPKQAIELITQLDDEVGVWAMTILLARYFEGQMKIAATAVPELLAASDEELVKEMSSV